ncbi:hypothetical protein GR268_47170, partial [Rhizobium leguminosarum]|nr:hypothetical protein [Rhizobium leguminosarum]
YIIAIRYYRNKDYQKAYECLKELANQGYAKAQHKIGLMYAKGEYVKKDTTLAIKYFKKSAKQGDKYAEESLWILNTTLKQEEDKKIRESIKQDKAIAEHNYKLGRQFYYNQEEKDDKKAIEFFTLAAEKGHDKAQFELG